MDLELTKIIGYAGTALVFIAYLPQIYHLIKERCSAGISIQAFSLWFIASILLMINAISIQSSIFIALQTIHIVAIGIIIFWTRLFEKGVCISHATKATSAQKQNLGVDEKI